MLNKVRLLTPGPTPLPERVRLALAHDMIHHRKSEFKAIMHRVQEQLRVLFGTQGPVLPLSCSGTGAMTAAVHGLFAPGEKVLVIEGGKFGQRWRAIAEQRGLTAVSIEVPWGQAVTPEAVRQALDADPAIRGVLVQLSETSTGVLHPVQALAQLTRSRDVLLVVDGISGVGLSPCPMDEWGLDCLLTGSQKGLMLPPGLALLALSPRAWSKAEATASGCFYFNLPKEKIATELQPEVDGRIQWRDECRLMVLHKDSGEIEHRRFKDIIDYFGKGDRFVLNDTKVFPAKLLGKKEKTGADIMVFLLRELNKEQRLWDVIVDPARKIRIGNKLYFGDDDSMVAEVIDNTTSRGRTLRFLYDGPYEQFKEALFSLGKTPVPEWVKTDPDEQTIFARNEGAVSAPAANLHFSRELLNRMILKDIEKTFITVHMGIGHFRKVDVEDLSKHKMDGERFIISEQAADEINATKRAGHKLCAVGITVIRALETYVTTEHEVRPNDSWTNKFIFHPYDFSIPDAIVSNFHLPQSTMLMTVAAFGGYENVMKAYEEALNGDYRFGPYGDALLII